MTIDEFIRDIAPKMKRGFIFYDYMGGWQFSIERPEEDYKNDWWMTSPNSASLQMFDIEEPIEFDDWTQSLRRVGCNE